jgi:hypothetical protein
MDAQDQYFNKSLIFIKNYSKCHMSKENCRNVTM